VKQTALIKRTLEVYPENKDLLFLLEAMPIPEANAFNIAYLAVLSKGKLSQSDLTTVYAAQLQNKLSPEETKQFITVLKKYPKQYQRCKDYIKLSQENLKTLDT
jgi:hypothetical protein